MADLLELRTSRQCSRSFFLFETQQLTQPLAVRPFFESSFPSSFAVSRAVRRILGAFQAFLLFLVLKVPRKSCTAPLPTMPMPSRARSGVCGKKVGVRGTIPVITHVLHLYMYFTPPANRIVGLLRIHLAAWNLLCVVENNTTGTILTQTR